MQALVGVVLYSLSGFATCCLYAAPLLIYIYMAQFVAKSKLRGMILSHLFLEKAAF